MGIYKHSLGSAPLRLPQRPLGEHGDRSRLACPARDRSCSCRSAKSVKGKGAKTRHVLIKDTVLGPLPRCLHLMCPINLQGIRKQAG